MSEPSNEKITNKKDGSKEEWNFEAEQNWLGFWNLLIKVDRRLHPKHYEKEEEND